MAGFELAEREAPESAELPVRRELDLVEQADAAGFANPVRNIAERFALADDRELEIRHPLASLHASAPCRCRLLDRILPGLAGQLVQVPGQVDVGVGGRDRPPSGQIDTGLIQ